MTIQEKEQKRFQIKDIVDFVLSYRGKTKAFCDQSANEIALSFSHAIDNNEAAFCIDPDGYIAGVVIGEVNHDYKLFHISNILTIHPVALKMLIIKFYQIYPGYELQANRHGKLIRYKNTFRFLTKLIKQKA